MILLLMYLPVTDWMKNKVEIEGLPLRHYTQI